MLNIKGFLFENHDKLMTFKIWGYTAWYRALIFWLKPDKLMKQKWGIRGEESSYDADIEQYRYAKRVAFHINKTGGHTPWESKCLVQALTARKLLLKKNIPCTLYLGVGNKDGKMVAHAWLRCGKVHVTGGAAREYATVAKIKCV